MIHRSHHAAETGFIISFSTKPSLPLFGLHVSSALHSTSLVTLPLNTGASTFSCLTHPEYRNPVSQFLTACRPPHVLPGVLPPRAQCTSHECQYPSHHRRFGRAESRPHILFLFLFCYDLRRRRRGIQCQCVCDLKKSMHIAEEEEKNRSFQPCLTPMRKTDQPPFDLLNFTHQHIRTLESKRIANSKKAQDNKIMREKDS